MKKNVECLNKFTRLIKKENWNVLFDFIIHVQRKALNQIKSRLKKAESKVFVHLLKVVNNFF